MDSSKRRPGAPIVLTVDEAAELLRISKRHLYEMVTQNKIRSVRLGRRVLIPVSALEELIGQAIT